jgi:hypothetical protein
MNYRNPKFTSNGLIDCEVDHPVYGWIPFTASPHDCEPHGRELFTIISANGGIAPYIPPPPPSTEELAIQVRMERDRRLRETDWTQFPDVPEDTRLMWQPYRQLLRDIPQQDNFPHDVIWPVPPA